MKKLFNSSQLLLRSYFIGNLIVLAIATMAMSLILSWSAINKEKDRSKISRQQLQAFLENKRKSISEEMWTGSYAAIGLTISNIAEQFGAKNFELQLKDENGKCVYSVNQSMVPSEYCMVPNQFSTISNQNESIPYEFGENSKFLYFSKLALGEYHKGTLYMTIDDPYHYYNGGIWGPALSVFLPNIILLSLLLFAWFLISNRIFFKPYLSNLIKLERSNAFNQVATQLAHDIRSPLAALEMISTFIFELPEDKRIIIRNSINRIRDLANSLLSNKEYVKNQTDLMSPLVETSNENQEDFEISLLDPIIDLIVTEKRMQYRDRFEVEIDYKKSTSVYGLFSKIKPNQIKRVLSNLINNSVEALKDSKGRIEVTLQSSIENQGQIEIVVKDTGKGIPSDQLTLLGNRGYSYDKPHGTGLGLNHAFSTIKSIGGEIVIDSTFDVGTTVVIKLNKSTPPEWFVPKISIKRSSSVVILDDDHSIHQVWKKRLEKYCESKFKVKIHHFTDPSDFQVFYRKNFADFDDVLFLMDFEITNSSVSGLDLIETLGIGNESILVTSHYENKEIRDRCRNQGVRLIPKSMSGFIPIHSDFSTS